jgi:hypothetical protein
MKIINSIIICFFIQITSAQKPKVWIFSDMTDHTLKGNNHMGTINDPDDVSAMAGYLLLANMFDTRGIVIGCTHRKENKTTPNQAVWANTIFGEAYKKDVINLNNNIGGYPEKIEFIQSSIKETAEKFILKKKYNIKNYPSVEAFYNEVVNQNDVINVLFWGSLTEPAIFVNYCISNNKIDLLNKVRFIAHWTNSPLHQGSIEKPEDVANCREDDQACSYLKEMSLNGYIKYYECGAIGQHGIVTGSPKGETYYNQFKTSNLGKLFVEGKYVNESVDHSDSATYWVLLSNWGVSLNDITNNGTNNINTEKNNQLKFKNSSLEIHNELLRRSKAATNK